MPFFLVTGSDTARIEKNLGYFGMVNIWWKEGTNIYLRW